MAAISTIVAAAAITASAVGSYTSYQGQKKSAAAQQEALDYQQQIEAKRQQQMELDATRRKRELVRSSIAARSVALATATAQGAAENGSSALPGAYGSISGRSNVNQLGVNQNLEIGQNIFDANQGMLGAYREAAAGQSMQAFGSGLSSLGNALLRNEGALTRVGTYFGSFFGGGGSPSGYDSVGTPYNYNTGFGGPR